MTHRLNGDGMHDDEPISRLPGNRAKWRQLLYSEKVVMTVLVAIFTAILGWLVSIGLETRDKMYDIASKINLHTELLAKHDQRLSVQEGYGQSFPIILDRVKAQEDRLQEHTRAIVTAEGILHELERGVAELKAHDAANIANHSWVETRLNEIYSSIKEHSFNAKRIKRP